MDTPGQIWKCLRCAPSHSGQALRGLLNEVLPSIHILDPACGSGAYLQAAMNSLLRIYLGASVETDHDDATMATIRRRIITDNLYGVDIAEEAVELTRLRLWLALIAAQKTKEPIAPMSAFECRVHCGNSLFGSLEKAADASELDQELLDEFKQLGIKYDSRDVDLDDIRAERPFYWGLIFDEVVNRFGGFDVIVTNPPWTSFRFDEREFFKESDVVHRRKLDVENIRGSRLLEDMELDTEYRDRRARTALMRAYYAQAREFSHARHYSQFSYELFVERIFTLLREGGKAGVLVPAGLLSDSATRDLRNLLLDEGDIRILLGISNRNHIFATLHPMFESCLMVFGRGRVTGEFNASFNVKDLAWLDVHLANQGFHVRMNGDLVREMSPNKLAIIEFRDESDIAIARRMQKFPPLQESVELRIGYSFGGQGNRSVPDWLQGVPVYNGRTISQYASEPELAQQAVERTVRRIRGKPEELNAYRLVCRSIGSRTNIRSMIATVVPRNVVCSDKLLVEVPGSLDAWTRFYLLALLNSFVIDYWIRQRLHRFIYLADVYEVPIPRLDRADVRLRAPALRAAKLVCIGPEFDDLAQEVGLQDHRAGIRDRFWRERVRAEIDGLAAHLYGLSESELLQVLETFPQVPDPEKIAVHNAYRDIEKGILR